MKLFLFEYEILYFPKRHGLQLDELNVVCWQIVNTGFSFSRSRTRDTIFFSHILFAAVFVFT